jgi:hypothetical protein
MNNKEREREQNTKTFHAVYINLKISFFSWCVYVRCSRFKRSLSIVISHENISKKDEILLINTQLKNKKQLFVVYFKATTIKKILKF